MGSKHIGLRMVAGALCFVGGFFFPLLFIPAVIIGMTLTATPEEQHEGRRPKPKAAPIEQAGIKAEDSDWKTRYLKACESPAESAFLAAMISSFSLKPDNGVLKATGLTLNMQVEMTPYRLDFLANGWLVIEIDGAAWHSSPQAVARDKARDEFFHSYDYTVLRIPAKVVFSAPQEAVRRVRALLAEGRKISTKPKAPKPVSAWAAVGGFVRGAGQFVEDLNVYVNREAAIQQAMSKPEQIYHAEKQAISLAMNHADRQLERQQLFAKRPELQAHYEENHAQLQAMLAKGQDGRNPKEELRQFMREKIVRIQEPELHPTGEINEAIRKKYASLMEERAAYFEEVKQKLTADSSRREMVQSHLLEMGCVSCWTAVAPKAANARMTVGNLFARTAPFVTQTQVPDSSSAVKPSASSERPSSSSSGRSSSEM